MKPIAIAVVTLTLLAAGYHFFTKQEQAEPQKQLHVAEELRGQPTFTWTYQTSEEEGIPQTEIRLTSTNKTGATETKVVDSIQGDCNAYEPLDEDVYQNSTMIICYYAGLGHYFKVVADQDGYMVQRKVFEEASPEYEPPVQPYETIVRF